MGSASVFIVEDEKIIARGIEKRLKGLGYAVAGTAATGSEAISGVIGKQPDIVLMDINLGAGMDGIETAHEIHACFDVPVIYLTAFSDEATLERAKVTEPHGYLLKPYEDRDLQTAIEIGIYRHKMDRRLRENEQWLASTLSSIGDGVIATDGEGRVRFLNPLAEDMTGWSVKAAAGRDVRDVFRIVNEQTRETAANPALEALQTGLASTLAAGSILIATDGVERPIDDSAAPIRDAHGRLAGSVLVFRDISDKRHLEELLRQAQKMEALGRLAGGIAHDFNNVMTVIIGFSDLLLAESALSSVQRECIENIHEAGKRAASLTQQIMAFSRRQMLVPGLLNLNKVVRDMTVMVRRLIGSDIQFETDFKEDLGTIRADPTQIGQIILNLAANARDAMPTGGKLSIGTTVTSTEVNASILGSDSSLQPGQYAVLSVADTGSGMSRDMLAHMFEPFFTTKEMGKGTGLGLATVYGIVKQSGGHIDVSSEVGAGTIFRVYLPLLSDQPTQPANWALTQLAKGHETILLVEDENAIRALTTTILEREGYTVLQAGNGNDALAIADAHQGTINLLMTDIIMPYLSGVEIAERLLGNGKVKRVLFVSGYADDMTLCRGVKTTAANFLAKPFQIAAMLQKVREVLDGESINAAE